MIRMLSRLAGIIACLSIALGAWSAEPATSSSSEPAAAPPAPPSPHYCIPTNRAGSRLDWNARQLEAVGVAYAPEDTIFARTQARITAISVLRHEAREALAAVPVSGTILLSAMLKDDAARRQAEQLVAHITIAAEMWNADTRAQTVVGIIPFDGKDGLAALLGGAFPAAAPLAVAEEQLIMLNPTPRGHTPQRSEGPYTGVIVDGDHAMLSPCLFPSILRFDGKEIWGPSLLTAENALAGPVRYAPNLAAALQEKLAGETPLIVSAIGTGQGDLPVLSVDDVLLLLTQHKNERVFDHLPIIITLGQH